MMIHRLLWDLIEAFEAHVEATGPHPASDVAAALNRHITANPTAAPPADLVGSLLTAVVGPLTEGVATAVAAIQSHLAAEPAAVAPTEANP